MCNIYCRSIQYTNLKPQYQLHIRYPSRIILHKYQYSSIEQNIYDHSNNQIQQWVTIDKNNKTIIRISNTIDRCNSIPQDSYPIQLCSPNSFLVHHYHAPITSNEKHLLNFTEYIQSMARWMYLLVQHYIVHYI